MIGLRINLEVAETAMSMVEFCNSCYFYALSYNISNGLQI